MIKKIFSIIAILLLNNACEPRTGRQPVVYPDASSADAKLYIKRCGACHVAPLPSQNTANKWRYIVMRMQTHMSAKAMPKLNRRELATITGYLEKHAKTE